jgi:mRNA interferase HigB
LTYVSRIWKGVAVTIFGYEELRRFSRRHPDSRAPLTRWYTVTSGASWRNFAEVRRTFPSADLVGVCTVFNIAGNKYRLIGKILYEQQSVDIRVVLTHGEYDRDNWKKDCQD